MSRYSQDKFERYANTGRNQRNVAGAFSFVFETPGYPLVLCDLLTVQLASQFHSCLHGTHIGGSEFVLNVT